MREGNNFNLIKTKPAQILLVWRLVIVTLFLLIILIILNFIHASNYVSAVASPDAIAIRVIPNPAHYSPLHWYQNQGFTGSPQSLTVDGYEAVRDGRTVYVNAANVDATNLYTNIYLISYNQDAESATVDIFGRILEHWKFNTNVTGVGVCSKSDIQTDCTGTVGCWPLNGDFKDYSGNNNNGSGNGNVLFTDGINDQAVNFNSNNDYINAGTDSSLDITQTITIEAWVKLSSAFSNIGRSGAIVGKFFNSSYMMSVEPHTDNIVICDAYFLGSRHNVYSGKLADLKWHHVVCTYDSSTGEQAAYFDGALTESQSIAGNNKIDSDLSMPVKIGGRPYNNINEDFHFPGIIDEVKIYNRALTPQEVSSKYTSSMKQCLTDNGCSNGGYCSSLKSRIIRDTLRLSELVEVKLKLAEFKQSNNHYPKLDSGTYLTNKTISVWPSWQETLAKELNFTLPIDPINKLGVCSGYDATTCWDEKNKKFDDPTPPPIDYDFNLPNGSNAYVYTTDAQGATYNICANMESGLISPTMGNCIGNVITNNPPVIDGVNLPTVGSGKEYIGYVEATDPDGDILSWSIDTSGTTWAGWSAPPVLQPAGTNSQKKIYAAKTGNTGTYDFYITVSDGRGGSYTNPTAYQIIIGNCVDSDSDGYGLCPNCGVANGCLKNGNDCDDGKNYINPGSSETCDDNDNNCNGQTDEGCDDDIDDYCDKSMKFYNYPVAACPNSNLTNGSWGNDCDDSKNNINSGATEVCGNGIDEDCNGSDLNCTTTCTDIDTDGYGSPASTACAYATLDCNDNDASVNPGAIESGLVICNGIDNDCDGTVDEQCDIDNDNYCNCGNPFAPASDLTAVCSGTNTTDSTSWANTCDCNDNNISINPGAMEICTNIIDDDCDNDIDCVDAQCFAAPSCVAACGDGVCNVAGGECSSCPSDNCTLAVCCGNLVPDLAVGEQCDDGKNGINDECTDSCAKTYCGDTIIQNSPQNGDGIAEQCDDGNTTAGDGCDENCQSQICTLWQIGDIENNQMDPYNDELLLPCFAPFINPFIIGVNNNNQFPSCVEPLIGNYADDIDVKFYYGGSSATQAWLDISWSGGTSGVGGAGGNEVKSAKLDGTVIGTTPNRSVSAVAGWWLSAERYVDTFGPFNLTPGPHTLTLLHPIGDGSPWDYIKFSALSCPAACLPQPSGMIGWWPGDGNANDYADGNNGTIGGAAFVAGKVEQAFSLNGSNNYVNIMETGNNLDGGFTELTINAWVNAGIQTWTEPPPCASSGAAVGTIVSKYNSNSGGVSYLFALSDRSGQNELRFNAAGANIISTNVIPTGWINVTGVWRGGNNIELYIDGIQITGNISGSGAVSLPDTNVPVNIGRIESFSGCYTGPGAYFNGQIDEVQIYNKALNGAEIKAIYDAGSYGMCK